MPDTATVLAPSSAKTTEHFDVLIVGAGISGVGGAYHLTKQCPGTSFVVLEAQESFGGTWITHRYPGIRSDSDLYTFGYRFKPWTGTPIATAEEILDYMGEVIEENDLARHIRYRHRIASATLVERRQSLDHRGRRVSTPASPSASPPASCGCARATTAIPKATRPSGRAWPTSRAASSIRRPGPRTSTTRTSRSSSSARAPRRRPWCPAIADDCAHVTMLQRSPTYFIPARNANDLADQLRQLEVDESWIHEIVRRKILHDQSVFTQRSFDEPDKVQRRAAGRRARLSRPRLRHRRALHAALPAVAAAHRLRAGRRPVPAPCARARRRSSPTRSSASPRRAFCLKSGQELDGRHHRHRHRLPPQRAGRHRLRDRRRAARFRRDRHLSRHDVHRRAQHGLGVRLLPRQLDLARPTWSPTSSAACSTT